VGCSSAVVIALPLPILVAAKTKWALKITERCVEFVLAISNDMQVIDIPWHKLENLLW
jgi:hypothetical protein